MTFYSFFFPVKEIIKLCPEDKLLSIYNVSQFKSAEEFLQQVATLRGKLKKGGVVDMEAAARIVLHDWNEGMAYFFVQLCKIFKYLVAPRYLFVISLYFSNVQLSQFFVICLGKIPYYTLPPVRSNDDIGESVIVSDLGREFNTEVYNAEASYIGNLTSVDDYRHVEVPALPPPKFDEDMLEEEVIVCSLLLVNS